MTIIALVIGQCLPITATLLHDRAATPSTIAGETSPIPATADAGRRAGEAINQWPLRFEVCDQGVPERFLARTSNCNIYLTATEAALIWQTAAGAGRLGRGADLGLPRNAGSLNANEQLPGPRRDRAAPRPRRPAANEFQTSSVRMQLIGANPRAVMAGEGALATPTNYFTGDDPKRWRMNVQSYLRVRAENIYRGVDVIYYGKGRQFEYDFNVAAGADPAAIRLRFIGAARLAVDAAGDLLIDTLAGTVRQAKPVAYQLIAGSRKVVPVRYLVSGKRDVRFLIGEYDKRLPLVIDPVLSYSTYFGGGDIDRIQGVAVDVAGNVYITGTTFSADLPLKAAFQPLRAEVSDDAFIAKLNGRARS
ncbi:MAG: hypothetical protein V7641_4164 [Blastocatellia bacterium]